MSACGEDTPLTPDAPLSSPTPDLATVVGLPVTPKGVPLVSPSPGATPTSTIVSRDANLTLPACTPSNEPRVDMPTNFAPNFPFPPGLKPIRSQTLNNDPNYVQIIGYVPLNLVDGVRYVLEEFPKAGYQLGRGDSESGEAEAAFTGNGWRGGFRMNEFPNCPGMTIWLIVVIKVQK